MVFWVTRGRWNGSKWTQRSERATRTTPSEEQTSHSNVWSLGPNDLWLNPRNISVGVLLFAVKPPHPIGTHQMEETNMKELKRIAATKCFELNNGWSVRKDVTWLTVTSEIHKTTSLLFYSFASFSFSLASSRLTPPCSLAPDPVYGFSLYMDYVYSNSTYAFFCGSLWPHQG